MAHPKPTSSPLLKAPNQEEKTPPRKPVPTRASPPCTSQGTHPKATSPPRSRHTQGLSPGCTESTWKLCFLSWSVIMGFTPPEIRGFRSWMLADSGLGDLLSNSGPQISTFFPIFLCLPLTHCWEEVAGPLQPPHPTAPPPNPQGQLTSIPAE